MGADRQFGVSVARSHAVVGTLKSLLGRSRWGHGLRGEGEGMKLPIKSPLHPALPWRRTFRGGETSTTTPKFDFDEIFMLKWCFEVQLDFMAFRI